MVIQISLLKWSLRNSEKSEFNNYYLNIPNFCCMVLQPSKKFYFLNEKGVVKTDTQIFSSNIKKNKFQIYYKHFSFFTFKEQTSYKQF